MTDGEEINHEPTRVQTELLRSLRHTELTWYGDPDRSLDALVLAGTHADPTKLIRGQNKALLPLAGRLVVEHVLDALIEAPSIGRVYVVGPLEDLQGLFNSRAEYRGRLVAVPQAGSFLENGKAAFRASMAPLGEPEPAETFLAHYLSEKDLQRIQRKGVLHWAVECLQALAVTLVREAWMHPRTGRGRDFLTRSDKIVERALTPPEYGEALEGRLKLTADRFLLSRGLGYTKMDRLLRSLDALHVGRRTISFRSADFARALIRREALLARPALVVTGDVPLITPGFVEAYLDRCDMVAADFAYGASEASVLEPFAPRADRPGIRRPFLYLRGHRLRIANISVVRPYRIGRLSQIQRGYRLRKATLWSTVFRLAALCVALPAGGRILNRVARFQATALLRRRNLFPRLAQALQDLTPIEDFERVMSNTLATRFRLVLTPTGGISIDIDDEQDYEVLCANFQDWKQHEEASFPPLLAQGEPHEPSR